MPWDSLGGCLMIRRIIRRIQASTQQTSQAISPLPVRINNQISTPPPLPPNLHHQSHAIQFFESTDLSGITSPVTNKVAPSGNTALSFSLFHEPRLQSLP